MGAAVVKDKVVFQEGSANLEDVVSQGELVGLAGAVDQEDAVYLGGQADLGSAEESAVEGMVEVELTAGLRYLCLFRQYLVTWMVIR
jgi:hypothetical protein